MPKKLSNERMTCRYFEWIIYQRHSVFYADCRKGSNKLGRHSLGTRDRAEAMTRLHELDQIKAVDRGFAEAPRLEVQHVNGLPLEEGRRLYEIHLNRPEVTGGPCAKTRARYRAAFDKFLAFAAARNITRWEQVTRSAAQAYLSDLEGKEYAEATLYLEGTFLKQVIKFLIDEGHLPASCRFTLRLRKSPETTTYCYSEGEFRAMLDFCRESPALHWLGDVIAGLGLTGLRISELASLRWNDVDLSDEMLHLRNDPPRLAGSPVSRRRTKNRRNRSLPIHPDLTPILRLLKRLPHGCVFSGPHGGKLDADRVRKALVELVLTPLSRRFTTPAGEVGFADGRLHSFRHYFCSLAANSGVPQRTVMEWLGHREARMVARYFHLHDSESKAQMQKLKMAVRPDGDVTTGSPAA